MNNWKKMVSIFLSVTAIFTLSSCGKGGEMSEPRPAPTGLSVPETRTRQIVRGDIFVSPDGDDKNDGAKESPVRTAQKALELARGIDKSEKVISFADGEYNISAVMLTKEDSGVTLFGENHVCFNGGVTLNTADFTDYKDNIKVLDLKKYGITKDMIGDVKAFGQYHTAEKYDEDGSLYCELFCDNKRMTLSRYPNIGEPDLRTSKIIDNGDSREVYTKDGTKQNPNWENMKNPRGGTFAADKTITDRVKSWTNSPDIWLFGYFQYDWADSTTPLVKAEDGSITTKYASVYGFKEGTPYYFFNVFEELDAENEWYIDTENQLLYFIPPADFESKTVRLSLETENLITIDGAENIVIDGISLLGTRASAIKGAGNNITVKNCKINNVGENAVELEGNHITVENNEITATGKAGVILTGGDRSTLMSSENVVTNNLIYNWSQVYQTYQAAVALHGVGAVCSHNEIYNSPHEAITYTGNNHMIEYNVIHDVVLKSSDAGAIYAGRSWSDYGTEIRYNCIYNIGSEGFTPAGIYFDDALSGQKAYGNLLVNIPWYGFLIGGGRDIEVINNMIVNAGTPFLYDDRAIAGIKDGGWFSHANTPESTLWRSLQNVNVNAAPWKAQFPQLSQLSHDFNDSDNPMFPANPANSTVKNNVIVNGKKSLGEISKRAKKYSDISENHLYKFKDNNITADGTYTLLQPIDGFEPLPLDKMGRTYTF